ncbi:hypothetical protein F5Y06DRAFT_276971 [Hypoxylon sp. FL0890]|nr:hypothetical protein F5Y06DRAFT_276971 [Hypoxylon sp. FL0890]
MADESMTDVKLTWDDPNFTSHITPDHLKITSVCEEFGNLLGICSETCEQVKRQVLAESKLDPLPALKVRIGFSEHDVVRYLGSRPGGQMFLALVCALVTAFDPWESAQILATLIEWHLEQKERCPLAEHIHPLLSAINARCQLSGFAEHIVDYEIIISGELRDRGHHAASLGRLEKTPGIEAVIKLVDLLVFIQAETLNERKVKAFSVYAGSCAPWIAALVRWWLHMEPPMVVGTGSSRSDTFRHGEVKVGIILVFQTEGHTPEDIKIKRFCSGTDRDDWHLGLGRAKQYGGLVRIETYFRLMLNAFRLDRGQANLAAVEVIPFALTEARKRLTMCSEGCVVRDRWGAPCETTTDLSSKKAKLRQQSGTSGTDVHKISTDRFEPFPERRDINTILRLVDGCGGKHMQDLRSKQMGMAMAIHDHPQASLFLGQMRFAYDLAEWEKGGFRSQLRAMVEPSATTIFDEQMAHIVAMILALSLFRNPEQLLVRPDPFIWKDPEIEPSTVISAICRLFRKQEACCDVMEWHRVCRKLAGESWDEAPEENYRERQQTILSCHGGQLVWPVILFSRVLPAEGESYLRLHWRRGAIYDEATRRPYQSVIGVDNRTEPETVSQSVFEIPSRLAISDMSASQSHIKVLRKVDGAVLRCAMARFLGSRNFRANECLVDPSGVFRTLASAERIGMCLHNPDVPMDIAVPMDTDVGSPSALPGVYLCSPEEAMPWYWDWANKADDQDAARRGLDALLKYARSDRDRPGAVAVVPATDNDEMRLFALSKPVGAHVAVRQRACLACCVKFCKEFGFGILVL